ncbi:MAG: hypothetical protein ACREDV_02210, partial [Methylocella sp.]
MTHDDGGGNSRRKNRANARTRHRIYFLRRAHALERVVKKLLDFFGQDMLQLFDIEHVLTDHMIRAPRMPAIERSDPLPTVYSHGILD